jgi:REP element-mobilizing transposase RayT
MAVTMNNNSEEPKKKKKTQSQPLRVIEADRTYLVTIRTQQQRLWFINNQDLEEAILYWLANYAKKHCIKLYGFVIMGNHTHMLASFPRLNSAEFFRDFHSVIPSLVKKHVIEFEGGKLWERRASMQALGSVEDIETILLYCALQAPKSGLTKHPKDYPGYNSFSDAVAGKSRTFKKLDYGEYSKNRCTTIAEKEQYMLEEELCYDTHPELLAKYGDEYEAELMERFEKRLQEILSEKSGFVGRTKLLMTRPGSKPRGSKLSGRYSLRPLVICSCPVLRSEYLSFYFEVYKKFKEAVEAFFEGDFKVGFPPGTFRPPIICCC